MNLREYLFRENIKLSQFADSLEYSRGHISGLLNGTRYASKRMVKVIEKATGGKVKEKDLPTKVPHKKRKKPGT